MEFKNKTVYEMLFKETSLLMDAFFVMISVIGLALMANIKIPLWPVPVTLQTFGVFLIAFFFGARKGMITIIAYILAGLSGLAVFTGWNSGISTLFGPTGGYLIGFIFMALFVGLMIEKGYGRTRKSVFMCMIVGEIIMYICGLIGLSMYLGNASIWTVLSYGLVPFIIGDILKIGLAVALFPYMWKGAERIKN